jgi:outer membrane protein assembly factor BamB
MTVSRRVALAGFLLALTGCRACTTKLFGPKVSSTTRAGHETWEAQGTGTVPTATVVDGVAIVGDGYNSSSLVGLDAKTGVVKWTTPLGDNGAGPVAAEGDAVTFTTESCTVYVADAHTGAIRWSKWLGDPLVSHPAIASGVVYVVAPQDAASNTHALFAFDAKDGKEKWRSVVGADAIGGPIAVRDRIYVATQDGTLSRFATSGEVTWSVAAGAISAPTTDGAGNFFVVAREHAHEGVRRIVDGDSPKLSALWHPRPSSAKQEGAESDDDNISQGRFEHARRHLGTDDSATLWSWQGGRPSVSNSRVFAIVGDELVAFDQATGEVLWTAPFDASDRTHAAPPLASGTKVFLATAAGALDVRNAATGTLEQSIPLGGTAAFPPVIDHDRILVSTTDGRVLSIKE